MTNWNSPSLSDTWSDFLAGIKARDVSVATLDYSWDTNVPTNAIGYNHTAEKFELFNGTSWNTLDFHTPIDAHIADTSIHQSIPAGSIMGTARATAPTGWLLCDGSAISRTDYVTLYNAIGTAYGVGNGSTTFNIPDLRQRFPLGKAASGTGNTLGATGGSIDHTHTTPNHTHTISGHTHTMGNHTHNVGAHAHLIPAHEHTVPAHSHDTKASGATIAISVGSGTHQHTVLGKEGGSVGSGANRPIGASSSNGSNVSWANVANSTGSDHTHANSAFTGKVGNVTSGNDGDNGFSTTDGDSLYITFNSDAFASGTPSSNTTDSSGTLTSNSGEGSGTSGSNNPPFLVINYIIKT